MIKAPENGQHTTHLNVRQHTSARTHTAVRPRRKFFAQWLHSETCLTRPGPCPADLGEASFWCARFVSDLLRATQHAGRGRSIQTESISRPPAHRTRPWRTPTSLPLRASQPVALPGSCGSKSQRVGSHGTRSTTPCQHNRMPANTKFRQLFCKELPCRTPYKSQKQFRCSH